MSRSFRTAGFALLMLTAVLRAAPPRDVEPEVVELPPLFVVDERGGPTWQYVALPGAEVLAACSPKEAQAFARDLYLQRELLTVLVPREFWGNLAQPELFVLYDRTSAQPMPPEILEAAQFTPPSAHMVDAKTPSDAKRAVPAMRFETPPNLFLVGSDRCATCMEIGTLEGSGWRGLRRGDGARLRISGAYVRSLLERRRPALPEWYVEGVVELLLQVELAENEVGFRHLPWTALAGKPPDPRYPETLTRFTPLEILAPPNPAWDGAMRRAHREHRALLLRWALDGESPARRAGFFSLVRRAADAKVSADVFRECFGVDVAAVQRELNRKLVRAVDHARTYSIPEPAELPVAKVRPASLAESASLLGEWQRLAAEKLVSEPKLCARYLAEARRNLRRPYDKGARDPALVAELALVELASGDQVAARLLLEEAVRFENVRPAALVELARLRLEEAVVNPRGGDDRISADQARSVIGPARSALAQPLPGAEVYVLLAGAWLRGELAADASDLDVLQKGLRTFPANRGLAQITADVFARQGLLPAAQEIVRDALRRFPGSEDQAALRVQETRLAAETLGR